MPRGKNYVNNDRGVSLQAGNKAKVNMIPCEYGSGCTRKDCIYRHEGAKKREEVCLPFLAGKCTFKGDGCRKRHPSKEEKARLLIKYKRTRCRFGDECFTDGCLYLHPSEMEANEPHYVEPHHIAFPPLNGAATAAVPTPANNSAWKATPVVVPPRPDQDPQQHPLPGLVMATPVPPMPMPPQGWQPMDPSMYVPHFAPPPYFDPAMAQGHPMAFYGAPMHDAHMFSDNMNFNAEAKEFIPGNPVA